MSNSELLKLIWDSVYDQNLDEVSIINKYFHPKYEQCINGVSMGHDDYIAHVIEQKKLMNIDSVKYKHILEKENEVFAIYYPKGMNKNNTVIEAEVIAYFRFEEQQLLNIHGQVRFIKGNIADADM